MFKKGNNIFSLLVIVLSIFMTSSVNIVNAAEGTDTPATSQTDSGSPGTTNTGTSDATDSYSSGTSDTDNGDTVATSSGDTDTTGNSSTSISDITPDPNAKNWGDQFITEVQLQDGDGKPQTSFGQYDTMQSDWEFSTQINGEKQLIHEGDTMVVKVPDELSVKNDVETPQPVNEKPSGNQIGWATLNQKDRTVTVVFNKYAATRSTSGPVVGSFYVKTMWDMNNVSINQTYPFKWTTQGSANTNQSSTGEATVLPSTPPNPGEILYKYGGFVDNEVQGRHDAIQWTVRVNYAGKSIDNAIYKDTIGKNQTLLTDDKHPITVNSARANYDTGVITNDTDNKVHDSKITPYTSGTGFEVDLGDISYPVMITYYTSIDNYDHISGSYSNMGDLLSNKNELQNITVNEATTTLGSDAHTSDETTSIMGHKIWQTPAGTDESTLPPVTINLIQKQLPAKTGDTATSTVLKSATVNQDTGWSYVFGDLPVYDENGNKYSYSVQEATPVDGYTSVTDPTNYDITNISKSFHYTIKVHKIWVDGNNVDHTRPDPLFVTLEDGYGKQVSDYDKNIQQIKISDSPDLTATFDNVPVSDTGSWGIYEFTADPVTGRPTDLPKYFSVTKYNNDAKTDITLYNKLATSLTVTKGWEDNNNSNRPNEVKVQLYANDNSEGDKPVGDPVTLNNDNNWTHKFGAQKDEDPTKPADPTNKLPKYDDNNKEIKYSAKEVSVPTGYSENDVIDTDGTNETITNTLDNSDVKTTSFKVTKKWVGDTVADRPGSIIVHLLTTDGKKTTDTGKTATLKPDANGNWDTYTWKDLAVNDASGNPIQYTVSEDKVTNYDSTVDGSDTGATITNTYTPTNTTPTKRTFTATKIWSDANNKDGIRPDDVQVQLTANDNNVGDPVTLNSKNGWTHTWSNLDKKNSYSVVETPVSGYETSLKAVDDNDLIITNTHTPKTPSTPGNPDKPTTPTNPTNPVTPTTPVSPSTPETPTNPVIPVEPNTPTTPTGSTPVLPTNPIVPTSPSQPTIPSTTTDKTGSLLPQTGSKEATWIYSLIGVLILGLVAYLFKKLA